VRTADRENGQALVEFSLAFLVFVAMVFGVIDLGRGIYQYNAVAQAAREIARVASVHPGSPLGSSAQIADVIAVQKALVPSLTVDPDTDITCVDPAGAIHSPCNLGTDSLNVVVTAPFSAVTPFISSLGPWTLKGSATFQIQ